MASGDPTYAEFDRLMRELEDWYADSIKARDYDASPSHGEGGHRILLKNRYPGPPWRRLWFEASDPEAPNLTQQAAIIRSLEEEIYGLTHGPSRSGPASGLHRGTHEFNLAVATAPGSLRQVARTFGLSHTAVRKIKLAFEEGQHA